MKLWSIFVIVFFTFAAFATIVGIHRSSGFELGRIPSHSSEPPPPADGSLYSQPYDFSNLVNGISVASGDQYIGADDFALTSDGHVDQVELWLIYAVSHPVDLNMYVYTNDESDTGPRPGGTAWSATIPAAQITDVDTGDDQWGYDIYHVTVDLGSGFAIPAGETHWFGVQSVGSDAVYWLVADPLWAMNACWSADNGATWDGLGSDTYECFFNLNQKTGLTPSTWGHIKSEF